MAEKKTEGVKVHMGEELELELRRLADTDSRKLSDFICVVLTRYVYGNRALQAESVDGANRGD